MKHQPKKPDEPRLVSASDLAKHYGVTVQAVAYWLTAPDFPTPAAYTESAGLVLRPLWALDEVKAWKQTRDKRHARANASHRTVRIVRDR